MFISGTQIKALPVPTWRMPAAATLWTTPPSLCYRMQRSALSSPLFTWSSLPLTYWEMACPCGSYCSVPLQRRPPSSSWLTWRSRIWPSDLHCLFRFTTSWRDTTGLWVQTCAGISNKDQKFALKTVKSYIFDIIMHWNFSLKAFLYFIFLMQGRSYRGQRGASKKTPPQFLI